MSQELWDKSFQTAIATQAYNQVPPEALVRNVSYYLRARYTPKEYSDLSALDIGCGAGTWMEWLVSKKIKTAGIDVSQEAVNLARRRLVRSYRDADYEWDIWRANIAMSPFPFREAKERFDIITSANVLQHLNKADRAATFAEIRRLLKPGGLACLHEMSRDAEGYLLSLDKEDRADPGTILFPAEDGALHLEGIGLTHFFTEQELKDVFEGFQMVDCLLSTYQIPIEEMRRRKLSGRLWGFLTCYAVK